MWMMLLDILFGYSRKLIVSFHTVTETNRDSEKNNGDYYPISAHTQSNQKKRVNAVTWR